MTALLPERPTRKWVSLIHRRPYFILMMSLVITLLAGYGATHLKLKTRIQDLLPQSSPSIKASEELNERLGSVDILVLTLMTSEFERVKAMLPDLKEALENDEEIREARWRQDITLIQRNALITFPTLPELKEAYQDLIEEIRRRVKEKMRLLDELEEGSTEDLALTIGERALDREEGATFKWGELEGEESLSEIGRTFLRRSSDYPEFFYNGAFTTIGLKVFPTRSSSDLVFCQKIIDKVDRITRELIEENLGPIGAQGVIKRVDLGGGYRHMLNASKKIKGDMLTSTLTSFALLSLVLIIAFRSLRAFFCIMTPLLMGTIWTMGLMALFVGYLNLITAFIFAVLLGLGIDFGIHFYGRYREERAVGHDELEAMVITHRSCGHASLLAAGTTSIAFLALTLADFKGLSQFGGVAALGVLSCLLAVAVMLPVIAFIAERWVPLNLMGYEVERSSIQAQVKASYTPFAFGKKVSIIGLLIGLCGICMSSWIQIELNFNRLGAHPKPAKVKKTSQKMSYTAIQYGTTKATSPTVAFAQSSEEARSIYDQLETLSKDRNSRVSSVQSLFSLIPTEQPERIKWVKKLCRKLKRKVGFFEGDQRAGAEEILTHCDPDPFEVADLPHWVKEKFTDRGGKLGEFIFISPRGSTSDGEVALAFHREMQSIDTLDGQPLVVAGKSMVWAEVLMALKTDGALTFAVALIMVLLMLFAFERSLLGLALVSAPLVLGLGITIGVMAIWELKLNFFNILALPTLIGMGVDDGVHMYHRYKEVGRGSALYIVKTTGAAATLTTLTTTIGFGSLMLADHRGLNSLGLLSVIGMCAALFSTLVILPALFTWWEASSQE